MNRCVLRTFGKKMALGTLKTIGACLAVVAFVAVLVWINSVVSERWDAIIEEALSLICAVGVVVLLPLAIGVAVLEALNDSYKECAK